MPALRETPAAPVKSGAFSYGSHGFVVGDVPRQDPARLNDLLFPEQIKGKIPQRYARQDAETMVKGQWVKAQLRHYGIACPSGIKVAEATDLLKSKVKSGACDVVPPSMVAIEAKLRDEYAAKQETHRADQARLRKEDFCRLSSPSAEAHYDVDMFLSNYFRDSQGKPDRAKTPNLLKVAGLSGQERRRIQDGTYKLPNLFTFLGGDYDDETLVIGWNSQATMKEAHRVTDEKKAQRQASETAEKERRMQKHQDYLRRRGRQPSHRKFHLDDARGQYLVECNEINEQWPRSGDLTLRISEGRSGFVGIFDFNVLEGVMRFGREPLSGASGSFDDGDSLDEDEDEDEDSDASDGEDSPPASKRQKTGPGPSDLAPASSANPAPAAAPPRRVYLQWRGRETGEGEIQLDYDNSNTGYLDFEDAGCTKFSGRARLSFVGSGVPFTGYKVGDLGGPITKSWEDYSESAYEAERIGRWR